MHGGVTLLGPLRQRLSAHLPDPLDDGVLGLIAGVERARAIFHFVKQSGYMVVKLRMALEARDQFGGDRVR